MLPIYNLGEVSCQRPSDLLQRIGQILLFRTFICNCSVVTIEDDESISPCGRYVPCDEHFGAGIAFKGIKKCNWSINQDAGALLDRVRH